jgi:hypothetical protein
MHKNSETKVTPASTPEARTARLVRNLLAMRTVLACDQMQTGRCDERIDEIDQELARLGHDMKSTAACAVEGLRRTFLLPRLVQRRQHGARRAGGRAGT